MRITQAVVRFPPFVGGVERTVYELSRRLVARGHEVTVVCAAEPPAPPELDGVVVQRLPFWGKAANSNLAWGIGRAVAATRPEIVHGHLPVPPWPDAAARTAMRLGVPFVLTYNNDIVGDGWKRLAGFLYSSLLLPRLLGRAARVVIARPLEPLPFPSLARARDRLVTIPWGVDLESLVPAPPPVAPPLVVGFLSVFLRHHDYKGLDVMLQALAVLAAEGSPVRLVVGGAGEELARYRRLADELGVADHVEWSGFIPESELAAFYGRCHVFVLPSTNPRREGFGLVAVEALACGRPLIATPMVAVTAAAVAAGAGRAVPPGDPATLAAELVAMAAAPESLREMGAAGRRLATRRFGWEAVTSAYEALFGELLGATTSSSK